MKISRSALILAAVLAVCLPSAAQTLQGSRDKKARLERDIKILERQLSDADARRTSATAQLDLLRAQTAARKELLAESEKELKAVTDSVRDCRRMIERTSARIDTLTERYSRLIRNAYKHRDARVWYMYILASEDIGQGLRRYAYLRRLSSELNASGRELKAERDTLQAQQERLETLQAGAKKLRDERAGELRKLKNEEEKTRGLVQKLQGDRKKYLAQIRDKHKQVEALNKEIERLIAAELDPDSGKTSGKKGAKNPPKKTSTKIDKALSGQFEANKGKLPWPAEGHVTGHFGRNPHPVYTKLEMPFNNGVNLAVDPDSEVRAVFNGEVKQTVMIPGYNQCVLVQHGEYFTFYCKLAQVNVKAGQKIKTGQVIGRVATMSGETQLHFQLWKGKTPQDPEKWLKR